MDTSSVLKQYEKNIYLCTTCRDGGCGTMCPVFENLGFESSTPRGVMRIAQGLMEGKLKITDSLIRKIYSCTDCGYCANRCSNNPHDVMLALRQQLIKAEKAHPYVERFLESYSKNRTPAFAPHKNRLNWLPEELRTPRKADVIFFAGCYASHHTQYMAKAVVKILDHAGVEWTTLGLDEWCCGEVASQVGLQKLSDAFTKHNILAINRAAEELGVTKVVTQCPGCFKTFKHAPKPLGLTLNAEMLHITEFYCQLIKEGKLKFKESKKTYVYQDGCHIGRGGGVYDAPRDIIKAIPGAKLVETEPRIRDLMQCCTGSLKRWGCSSSYALPAIKYYRDLSQSIIRKRFRAVKETGAEVLTSTCGGCHRSFVGGNFERANKQGIDIVQISTLIADLMI